MRNILKFRFLQNSFKYSKRFVPLLPQMSLSKSFASKFQKKDQENDESQFNPFSQDGADVDDFSNRNEVFSVFDQYTTIKINKTFNPTVFIEENLNSSNAEETISNLSYILLKINNIDGIIMNDSRLKSKLRNFSTAFFKKKEDYFNNIPFPTVMLCLSFLRLKLSPIEIVNFLEKLPLEKILKPGEFIYYLSKLYDFIDFRDKNIFKGVENELEYLSEKEILEVLRYIYYWQPHKFNNCSFLENLLQKAKLMMIRKQNLFNIIELAYQISLFNKFSDHKDKYLYLYDGLMSEILKNFRDFNLDVKMLKELVEGLKNVENSKFERNIHFKIKENLLLKENNHLICLYLKLINEIEKQKLINIELIPLISEFKNINLDSKFGSLYVGLFRIMSIKIYYDEELFEKLINFFFDRDSIIFEEIVDFVEEINTIFENNPNKKLLFKVISYCNSLDANSILKSAFCNIFLEKIAKSDYKPSSNLKINEYDIITYVGFYKNNLSLIKANYYNKLLVNYFSIEPNFEKISLQIYQTAILLSLNELPLIDKESSDKVLKITNEFFQKKKEIFIHNMYRFVFQDKIFLSIGKFKAFIDFVAEYYFSDIEEYQTSKYIHILIFFAQNLKDDKEVRKTFVKAIEVLDLQKKSKTINNYDAYLLQKLILPYNIYSKYLIYIIQDYLGFMLKSNNYLKELHFQMMKVFIASEIHKKEKNTELISAFLYNSLSKSFNLNFLNNDILSYIIRTGQFENFDMKDLINKCFKNTLEFEYRNLKIHLKSIFSLFDFNEKIIKSYENQVKKSLEILLNSSKLYNILQYLEDNPDIRIKLPEFVKEIIVEFFCSSIKNEKKKNTILLLLEYASEFKTKNLEIYKIINEYVQSPIIYGTLSPSNLSFILSVFSKEEVILESIDYLFNNKSQKIDEFKNLDMIIASFKLNYKNKIIANPVSSHTILKLNIEKSVDILFCLLNNNFIDENLLIEKINLEKGNDIVQIENIALFYQLPYFLKFSSQIKKYIEFKFNKLKEKVQESDFFKEIKNELIKNKINFKTFPEKIPCNIYIPKT